MSLRWFHLLFIIMSTLLAFGFGVWATMRYAENGDVVLLLLGILSFAGTAGLVGYGLKARKKLKGLNA